MAAEIQTSITLVFFNILSSIFWLCIFVSNLNREQILSNLSKMVDWSEMARKNQISSKQIRYFRINVRVYNIFQSSFCIFLRLVRHKFCEKNSFPKNPRWRLKLNKSIPATILDFSTKLFFYKICVLLTPNKCKK
jgi:hypothetical protein